MSILKPAPLLTLQRGFSCEATCLSEVDRKYFTMEDTRNVMSYGELKP